MKKSSKKQSFYITYKKKKYRIVYYTIETNSNYNLSVSAYRNGEKTPYTGSILKKNSTRKDMKDFFFSPKGRGWGNLKKGKKINHTNDLFF